MKYYIPLGKVGTYFLYWIAFCLESQISACIDDTFKYVMIRIVRIVNKGWSTIHLFSDPIYLYKNNTVLLLCRKRHRET